MTAHHDTGTSRRRVILLGATATVAAVATPLLGTATAHAAPAPRAAEPECLADLVGDR